MSARNLNKRKIFNDPVYGFIPITDDVIFDIIEHPFFQRLRRIKQLGLTHLVYPGALHTRFQHSLGAMYLMGRAISELKMKGHEISYEELVAAQIAMLLHDIGHGPYSHALEHSIVHKVSHESISKWFMERLNKEFDGKLQMALDIFEGRYQKHFLQHLVSSQFDMDRLDYLKRDSFFTGVAEGTVNYERLLNMLQIANDQPVIEIKGIYSVEKFITARRLMYWQVYLHKTVLAAEYMAIHLLKRAKFLAMNGETLFATPALKFFLENAIQKENFLDDSEVLEKFAQLDDFDIYASIKVWKNHPDKVLSTLSRALVDRKLFRIELQNNKFGKEKIERIKEATKKQYELTDDELSYFVFNESTSNYMYKPGVDKINILFKDGVVQDITEVSDQLNINMLSKPTTKFFLCYPKDILIED
ncbi:MAG: HD domain-containing protein [Bacteroidales bacterium]|nr:HD domain-containing protein [Bacteroidales bacterium]